MRLLIDECIPRRFKASLHMDGYECLTVPEAGFAGKTNGELLRLIEERFDVFITLDKGFAYQQIWQDEESVFFWFEQNRVGFQTFSLTLRPAAAPSYRFNPDRLFASEKRINSQQLRVDR